MLKCTHTGFPRLLTFLRGRQHLDYSQCSRHILFSQATMAVVLHKTGSCKGLDTSNENVF